MAELKKDEMIKIVESNISKLENKDFTLYFFILDTKGNPSSSLEYIYKTALFLSQKGYKVEMIHNEKEFVGVEEWLGKEYAELPHKNIDTDNVELGPSDFLFVPEIFSNVLVRTKKLNCKRVVLVQNYNHITEFMPVSQTLGGLGVTDAIVTTQVQEEKIKKFFPEVRTHIVSPSISPVFRANDKPRDLIINLITKNQENVNKIVKPFYWENPIYKWVSFRELRGLPQEVFAEGLRTGAVTIWIDDDSNFGTALLEAAKCGGIVLAKTPTHPADWMLDENGDFTDSVIWFEDIDDVPDMLVSIVRSWTLDAIPEKIYEDQSKVYDLYTEEQMKNEIEEVYVKGIIERRLNDFKEVYTDLKNNVIKTKED